MTQHTLPYSALQPATRLLMAVAVAGSAASCAPGLARHAQAAASACIRINQVGYIGGEAKDAVLMATGPETGATFDVVDNASGQVVYSAAIGTAAGRWNALYPDTYHLDFSAVAASGSYYLRVSGPIAAQSPVFRIDSGASLYGPLLPNALFFYLAQRDGPNVDPNVMQRQPSHLTDAQALTYLTPRYVNGVLKGGLTRIGGPIDVSGGWFDAGDYLKFVETASYVDAVMLLAVRQYPALFVGGTADFASAGRFGLDWLNKMWDQNSKTLYYQVGIGDGTGQATGNCQGPPGSIIGDHDCWRLPQADDQLQVKQGDPAYYIKYRPVFRAAPPGGAISPNLAGRLAADFGLCYQLYQSSDPSYADSCLLAGETIFDLARTSNVGTLLTAAPHGYYPEQEWRDDMELGAAELYFATVLGNLPPGLPHTDPSYYLKASAHWANAYMHSRFNGTDSLNLYDVSGIAHDELYHAIEQAGNPGNLEVTLADLLNDLHDQLNNGVAQAAKDPFGFGLPYGDGSDAVPHALGYALEAGYYDELAGVSTYQSFGQTQRNWLLGANAWGSSFIVGAGSTFPDCMQHQVANLVGSLDGTPPIVLGATVDGPNSTSSLRGLGLPSGARRCPPGGGNPFAPFDLPGARYLDNVISWPSVEPTDDYTVLGLLVFARQIVSSEGKYGDQHLS